MEYFNEWWTHNGRPLVDAVLAGDAQQIATAVKNIPQAYVQYIKDMYKESPGHVIIETFLICFIIYITFFKKSDDPAQEGGGYIPSSVLTKREVDELLEDWQPEPLVPKIPEEVLQAGGEELVVEASGTTHVKLQGRDEELLNFATFDYLGIGGRPEMKEVSLKTMDKLEDKIAKFFGTKSSITYSDNASTSSSAVPAFSKKGDLLIVDAGVYHTLTTGVQLSRSQTIYYKHNDMEDLERVLKAVQDKDRKLGRSSDCQRRFIVTEGLFHNYGDVCDLPTLVKLKEKYFYRLIVDETNSIGVLGKTGRGLTEHFNLPISCIDILTGSLEYSLASIGGFCIGKEEVVDHQRLGGAGYVYSASAPPFLCAAATRALEILEGEGETLLKTLRDNAKILYEGLRKLPQLEVTSELGSPIIYCRISADLLEERSLDDSSPDDWYKVRDILGEIRREALNRGLVLVAINHIPSMVEVPPPTLRLIAKAVHTKEHIQAAIDALGGACEAVLGKVEAGNKKKASTPKKKKDSTDKNKAVDTPLRRSTRTKKPADLPNL